MLAAAYLLLFFLGGYALMCWQFPQKEPVVRAYLGMGAGLALAGLSILWFLLCNLTAKGMWKLGKLTLRGIKACFIRKKGA